MLMRMLARLRLLLTPLLVSLLLAACGGGGGSSGFTGEPAPDPPAPTQAELEWAQAVIDLVNIERRAAGVGALTYDAAAAQAAYGHAYDMEVRGFFSHVNPTGEDPWARLLRAGAVFQGVGENIARGQDTPQDVMNAWMASPGHRENLLRAVFGRMGVGVRMTAGGPWWVQNFLGP